MLRKRILTALILLPPFIAALYYLPFPWIAVLSGAFIAAAAWEWGALAGLAAAWQRWLFLAALLALGGAGIALVLAWPSWAKALFLAAVAWWTWSLADLARIRRARRRMAVSPAGKIAAGMFVLIPAWTATLYLHAEDAQRPLLLLFVFVLVWTADSLAYLTGHLFGRRKLAPAISPGKTVEGVLGGLTGVVIVAAGAGPTLFRLRSYELAVFIVLAAVAGLFSVVGDLVESRFKRLAGVKDSGHLLPGHGGILDRIDAFTAAAPVFAAGWIYLLKPAP